ncbi:MAG TPA: hypothetical protein VFZ34_02330 [Blastocatellia bacterium]|nr:hypothetical protein [Blastocatellia bacterium]
MFWEITSFLLLFGATFFAPVASLDEGISTSLRAEQPAATAPAPGANGRVGTNPVRIYAPGSRPKCNLSVQCQTQ